jgi:hypothetical protein
MRAILSRVIRPDSPWSFVLFEEFQEALGPTTQVQQQFSRLLALARYKRCSLWFINQMQAGQIDPSLVRLLRTNTGFECAFRANAEDARAYLHAVSVPKGTKRPAEARQALVEQLTRLERRQFLFWAKGHVRAQVLRSPRIDMDALRAAARTVSPDLRERIERGIVARELNALRDQNHALNETEVPLFLQRPAVADDGSLPPLG